MLFLNKMRVPNRLGSLMLLCFVLVACGQQKTLDEPLLTPKEVMMTIRYQPLVVPFRQPLSDVELKKDPFQSTAFVDAADIPSCSPFSIALHHRRAKQVVAMLREQQPGVSDDLFFDEGLNRIWLRCGNKGIDGLEGFIQSVDQPIPQFKIDAQILYVDSAYEKSLGLNFSRPKGSYQHAGMVVDLPSVTAATSGIIQLMNNDVVNLSLSALETEGHGEVLSRPSLMALNQKTAEIRAGQEVPYQETAENGATSVAFKQAVLMLRVTPERLSEGRIFFICKLIKISRTQVWWAESPQLILVRLKPM